MDLEEYAEIIFKDPVERKLFDLQIIFYEERYVMIDIDPDYNLTGYEGLTDKTYVIRNSWDFSSLYESVISTSFCNLTPKTSTITSVRSECIKR